MEVNLNQKIEAARAGSAAKASEEAAKKASEEAEAAKTVESKESTQPSASIEAAGSGVNEVPAKISQ
jgi:hypothetical protein